MRAGALPRSAAIAIIRRIAAGGQNMAFEDYKGAMFGPTWKTSARQYGYIVEHDITIPMSDGIKLNGDLWQPDA
jgi:predicted acyl esterase